MKVGGDTVRDWLVNGLPKARDEAILGLHGNKAGSGAKAGSVAGDVETGPAGQGPSVPRDGRKASLRIAVQVLRDEAATARMAAARILERAKIAEEIAEDLLRQAG